MSTRTTFQEKTAGLQEYIKKMAPSDDLLSECLWQLKPSMEEEPEGLSWTDKPLHSMYYSKIEEVADIGKTYQCLEKAGLKDSTEALIMVAQEQALNTSSIEARVYHTRQDPRCRQCKDPTETEQHITAYMERHNQVAGIIHRNICGEYRL